MTQSTYRVEPGELYRLILAHSSIRNPEIRSEFLTAIEAWSQDQWSETER